MALHVLFVKVINVLIFNSLLFFDECVLFCYTTAYFEIEMYIIDL